MKKLIDSFQNEGVKVVFRPLRTCSGALFFFRGRWWVFVNSSESWTRQRFTLAHELCHFKFHRHLGDHFTDFGGSSPLEREANRWAAEYLMPAALVFSAYIAFRERESLSVENLASFFGVSKKAMEIRLKELGLGKEVRKNEKNEENLFYRLSVSFSCRMPANTERSFSISQRITH